jgi:hypothetical protein
MRTHDVPSTGRMAARGRQPAGRWREDWDSNPGAVAPLTAFKFVRYNVSRVQWGSGAEDGRRAANVSKWRHDWADKFQTKGD